MCFNNNYFKYILGTLDDASSASSNGPLEELTSTFKELTRAAVTPNSNTDDVIVPLLSRISHCIDGCLDDSSIAHWTAIDVSATSGSAPVKVCILFPFSFM